MEPSKDTGENPGGSWVLNGNGAKIGDAATKGGAGAVLAILFMFASDFREDQKKILEKFGALEIKFVKNDADKNEIRTQLTHIITSTKELERDVAAQREYSRRNLEAIKMLAREMTNVAKKDIVVPPLGDF